MSGFFAETVMYGMKYEYTIMLTRKKDIIQSPKMEDR